ncbi:MAG: hypothetical protein EBT50_09600, partial [Verrucomicrobia bacterium]|nr:hypothetical protein [Verrucomicrobiota bacterium]
MNWPRLKAFLLVGFAVSWKSWAGSDFEQGLVFEKCIEIYKAKASFQKALAADQEAPGVAEHTAWFLYLNGFHDEECLTLLRQAAPKSQDPVAMEMAAKQVERELGLRGAMTNEEKAEQKSFQEAQLQKAVMGSDAERGGALVDGGKLAEGIQLLESAVKSDPENLPLQLKLARALYWNGQLKDADRTYTALLKKSPKNPALLLEQGQVAASEQEFE